jgi:hypothetical protein
MEETMNWQDWQDPAKRLELIERVGPGEYGRLHGEHLADSTVAIVNGHAIRPVGSERYGRLFMVGRTGRAFQTLAEASAHAERTP